MALRIVTHLAVACGVGLALVGPALAQQQRTQNQISSALVQLPAGSLSAVELTRSAAERRLIEEVRKTPTRAIKSELRERLAAIATDKPGIDLEIGFDYDSAAMSPQAVAAINELGKALAEPDFKGQVFLIEGHADIGASESYHLNLADRRAEAVKQYLVDKFKLTPTDLVAVGYGRAWLKTPADGPVAVNRRIRIVNITP